MTILYRHRVPSDESLNEDTGLIEEHFFTISPDLSHDHNFTQEKKKFTDSYASQYISRAIALGICRLPKKVLAIVLLEFFF